MPKATITLQEIEDAARRLDPYVYETPMLRCTSLSDMTVADLHLKAELFQKTGSFKVRGALNKILSLTQDELHRGVATLSAGNAAAAVAYAATLAGTQATVCMPVGAVPIKVEATQAYGARVQLIESDLLEAYCELIDEHELVPVHPFDDDLVIAGAGTVGLEILKAVPDVDLVVVPVGGGGLISGIAAAIKASRPEVRVVGVEPATANAVSRSLKAGSPQRLPTARSLADGLAAPFCGDITFRHIVDLVDDVVEVTEDEIAGALRLTVNRTKLAVEPSAAAPIAALLAGKIQTRRDTRTVTVLSGGNVDLAAFAQH